MKKDSDFAKFGLLLFLVFGFFSFLVAKNLFIPLDFDTTVRIQDKLSDFLISPFSVFSLLGTAETASLILLVLWLIIPKLRKLSVLFLYLVTGVIEVIGKSLIEQKGPPIAFLKTHLPFQFPSSYIPHEFFSYPSGHSARTAFISGILLFAIWKSSKLNKKFKFAIVFLILTFDSFMFLSRVYLGEHWTTDVVGGALLGFSLALLIGYFLDFKATKK